MIVSCSRRTDVPALYGAWLRHRLTAGFAEVPHPFDARRVRRVDLRPAPDGDLEALVLWTRDPGPVLDAVADWEARGVRTLWLVTVTGYPRDLEPSAPRREEVVASLKRLSDLVGPERVVWRYDPVLLCPATGLDAAWHRDNFLGLCRDVLGAVRRCIVSVWDDYAKARRRLESAGLWVEADGCGPLLGELAALARSEGIEVRSCCEDLEPLGVLPGACIDGELLRRLWGLSAPGKDAGQRPGCRCAPSVDLGVYDTCVHGCLYCYATGSAGRTTRRRAGHDPLGESLA